MIAQQLSTRVADTLTARLHRALEGDVSPARVLALDTQLMRDSGLSNAKTRTIRGLAHALHSGDLDLDALVDSGDDDRLRQELTALWGSDGGRRRCSRCSPCTGSTCGRSGTWRCVAAGPRCTA